MLLAGEHSWQRRGARDGVETGAEQIGNGHRFTLRLARKARREVDERPLRLAKPCRSGAHRLLQAHLGSIDANGRRRLAVPEPSTTELACIARVDDAVARDDHLDIIARTAAAEAGDVPETRGFRTRDSRGR